MEPLSTDLNNEGYPVEFVIVGNPQARSDANFVGASNLRIFDDQTYAAWDEMGGQNSAKHDTFVYGPDGSGVLRWISSENNLEEWQDDIRAAVVSQGM